MSGDANEAVRLKEQRDAERGFDADSDAAHVEGGGEPDVTPPPSAYGDRDPKTEMPVVPTAPETHEDPQHEDKLMPDDKPKDPHK
jgi:hypothetical protein